MNAKSDPKRVSTKERLIDAAVAIFAERGFEKATIQDIAERAGANIAAVNYHFGSKERFHAEVIRAQLDRNSGRLPDLADSEAGPEEQLATFIGWFLRRVCGPASQAPLQHILMKAQREDGSQVLDAVVEQVMRPQFERLSTLVAALLPQDVSPDVLRRQAFSVIGQITGYRHAWPVMNRLFPDLTLDETELSAIADHVTRNCLAALAAERNRTTT